MKQEFERLKDLLRETNPCTEKYEQILNELDSLVDIAERAKWAFESTGPVQKSAVLAQEPETVAIETKDTETYSADTTDYVYTKEAVREILTEASKNGVKIQPIMKQFIPEGQPAKLSSVPATSFAALVEAVQNAG